MPGQSEKWLSNVSSSSPDALPDAAGLPYTSFDHSKAHFYRYDEQVSLCLERLKWDSLHVFVYLSHILSTSQPTLDKYCVFLAHHWLEKIRPNFLSRSVICTLLLLEPRGPLILAYSWLFNVTCHEKNMSLKPSRVFRVEFLIAEAWWLKWGISGDLYGLKLLFLGHCFYFCKANIASKYSW